MFPIAHAWLVTRIVERPTPAHYLGCVWPDMLFGSPLDHTQSHRSGRMLAAHATALDSPEHAPVFRQFVIGVLTHGSEPRGFDWYSDEEYGGQAPTARGYAFRHGRALADETARACGLPPDLGWWKAHNIIEMAFERGLFLDHPGLGASLAGVCADNALTTVIAGELSALFATPAGALSAAMRRFPSVVSLHPATHEALAEVYAAQVRLKHPNAAPDIPALTRLIAHAGELISDSKRAYLTDCARLVGEMVADVLPANDAAH
ncbi:MAG TPA: hypothetical protein VJN88_02625 [Ktedonobacterales bacterium]|nr:hypothetical protein [Ktedonobacterales bacterium]